MQDCLQPPTPKELLFDETQPEIGCDDPPGDNVGIVGDAGSKDDEHKGDGDKHEATVAGSHGGKMGQKGENEGDGDKHESTVAGSHGGQVGQKGENEGDGDKHEPKVAGSHGGKVGQKGENEGDGDKHEPTVAGSDGQKGDGDRKRRANMSPNSKAMAEERRNKSIEKTVLAGTQSIYRKECHVKLLPHNHKKLQHHKLLQMHQHKKKLQHHKLQMHQHKKLQKYKMRLMQKQCSKRCKKSTSTLSCRPLPSLRIRFTRHGMNVDIL